MKDPGPGTGLFLHIVALCWLVLAVPALGQTPTGHEAHAELEAYFAAFEGLAVVDGPSLERARRQLLSAPPEAVIAFERQLAASPRWRALPRALALLEAAEAEHRSLLEAALAPAGEGPERGGTAADRELAGRRLQAQELEVFRADFLYFVARLQAFGPLVAHPDFDRGLARAERLIGEFPAERLDELRTFYAARAPGWKARLTLGRDPGAAADPLSDKNFDDCIPSFDFDCSASDVDCWFDAISDGIDDAVSSISCFAGEIEDLVTDFFGLATSFFGSLSGVLDDVEDFFTGLWNTIENGLEALWEAILDVIPDTPEEVLDLLGDVLGLDVPSLTYDDPTKALGDKGETEDFWLAVADTVLQVATFSIECNQLGMWIGEDLGFFGVVGTARSEWICKRGVDWFTDFIWKVPVPNDTKASAVRPFYGVVTHFPIKFFCKCLETQSALSFDLAQADHRDLVESVFDVDLETRTTAADLTSLRARLDALADPELVDLEDAVDDGVDGGTDAASRVADLDADVAVVAGLADDLGAGGAEQSEQIASFEDQTLRLRIEENLLREAAEDAVAFFQSPTVLAGYLETVRGIVSETIEMTAAAGEETFKASNYLHLADRQFQEGAFEKAYETYGKAYREAVKADAGGFRSPKPRSPKGVRE